MSSPPSSVSCGSTPAAIIALRSTATTATVGIDLGAVPYARAQNFGHAYSVGGRSWYLPPREYFFASPETIRRMSDRLAADVREYLLEAVR